MLVLACSKKAVNSVISLSNEQMHAPVGSFEKQWIGVDFTIRAFPQSKPYTLLSRSS